MRPQAATTRQSRKRKLNKSAPQPVLREDEIEPAEYNSLQDECNVETGVEKSEEKEYHLQAALAANSGVGSQDDEKEIPAPPAQESQDIDYDTMYSLTFEKPATYIRFSQTVEDCTGCQYNMSTEDSIFLQEYNQKKTAALRCSEDDFEKIMEILEETADIQAPHAVVDGFLVPFQTMNLSLKQQLDERALTHSKDVYEYWRVRRQECGNHPVQPTLKFEKNAEKDDGDPYVCFRRRDVRLTRKTRGRDLQSTDKLKKLRKELEEGRHLVELACSREQKKRDFLNIERRLYEQRVKFKEAKVRLGIKGDDQYLLNEKPPQRKNSCLPRQPGIQHGRVQSTSHINADLVQLSVQKDNREKMLQAEIEQKAAQHRKWNQDHIDLTREPLSPIHGHGIEAGFRPATAQYQYLMTPPSSVTSESFDHPSPSNENHGRLESFAFTFNSRPEEDDDHGQPAYRRRIGRCGRLWIDRRGMPSSSKVADTSISDRWKYDQDDNGDQPVYEMDPYSTTSMRFRATFLLPSTINSQRYRHDEKLAQMSKANPSNPTNNRAMLAQDAASTAPT